ncbi:MAG TPA: DUF2294 domain-containing protein [Solirubrobacteraceae bacterium]|nr:DUF2294 domain-containing protein [Solirubrobacteraceae bacterium]
MHRPPALDVPSGPPTADGHARARERPDGRLNAAISNAVVGIFRDYLGRGPTKARTSIRDNVVLVVLEETLTKAEKVLVDQGQAEAMMQMRRALQETMRETLTDAVTQLTARKGIAFMSDNHAGPDLAAEVFVLEAAPQDGRPPQNEGP